MSDAPRTILVTGATSGIGRAICARLRADGHAVVGLGRRAAELSGEDPELEGVEIEGVEIDFADLDALPDRLRSLGRRHPGVDGLVLSAGRGELANLEELSYRQIRGLLDLNFTSQAFVVRAFLPALKRRGRGDVVFIGSEAALAGSRQGSIYCASKFALRGFAQALRDECAKSGVRVSIVNPGMVRTPFFEGLPIEPGGGEENALLPAEVAEAVALVLAQRPGAVIDEINLSPLKKVVVKRKG